MIVRKAARAPPASEGFVAGLRHLANDGDSRLPSHHRPLGAYEVIDGLAKSMPRPVGDCDGISIAPALDTAMAVIILALPPRCESLPGPKSFKSTTV